MNLMSAPGPCLVKGAIGPGARDRGLALERSTILTLVHCRENDLCMEEENIKAKKMKLQDMEDYVEEQKQITEDEKKELENKEKMVEINEAEVTNEKENLR